MSSVKGIDNVIAKLMLVSKEFQTEVKEIVEVNVGDLEMEAIRNAPGPGDRINVVGGSIAQDEISSKRRGQTAISQGIGYQISPDGYSGRVFVEKSVGDVAAYVEFGTGQDAARYLATVDPEWREQARKFYVNGKGRIIGQPYLYPAYLKYRLQFINELKALVANTKF